MLSALAPTSVRVEPLEWPMQKVPVATPVNALTVQQDMAKTALQLLDPNAGGRLKTSA